MTTATADIDLMAHLMRRAGFGATREEIEGNLAISDTKTSSRAFCTRRANAALSTSTWSAATTSTSRSLGS